MFIGLMRAKKGLSKLVLPAIDVDGNWVWNNATRPTSRTATSFYQNGGGHSNLGFHRDATQDVKGGFIDLTVTDVDVNFAENNFLSLYDKAQANVFSAANYNQGDWYGAAFYQNHGNMYFGPVTAADGQGASPNMTSADLTAVTKPLLTGFRFQVGWYDKSMWVRHDTTTLRFGLDYAPNGVFFGCAIYAGTLTVDLHDFHYLY